MSVDGLHGTSALTLSLAEGNNGTFITSTRSLLFGNVTVRMRSAVGAGIVTSFSLLSGTEDEILFEWALLPTRAECWILILTYPTDSPRSTVARRSLLTSTAEMVISVSPARVS